MELQQYYIRFRGRVEGPFTADELVARQSRGRFGRHYEVSFDRSQWKRAADILELFPARPFPTYADAGSTHESPAIPGEEVYDIHQSEQADTHRESLIRNDTRSEEYSAHDDSWYYAKDGKESDPVSYALLQFLVGKGDVRPDDFVWTEGMTEWVEVRSCPGLLSMSTTSECIPEAAGSTPSRTSTLAVASLILGLLGTTLLFYVGSILAIVFGHMALRQIARSRGAMGGRGMAIAGLVLGYVVVTVSTLAGITVALVVLMAPP